MGPALELLRLVRGRRRSQRFTASPGGTSRCHDGALYPLCLKIDGDLVAKPFFTRRNPITGNLYTRFAMMDPFDAEHRQRLHGWCDEIQPDGQVRRTPYSMHWRPLFRYELEQMLKHAGFSIESLEGGHRKEAYTAQSPKLFVLARRH